MKNVLILSPQPFFETRGTPLNVREMLYSLSDAGYNVTLLAYPFGKNIEIPNVKILRSPGCPGINSVKIGPSFQKIILDILFFLKAIKLGFSKKYDVFHGIEEAAHMACILSYLRAKPFIADVDSCIPEQLENSGFITNKYLLNILVQIEKICFGKAAKVLTVCQALSDEVKKIQPAANISQIEDFPIEEETNNETIDLRSQYSIPTERKILLYAGNFESYQGVELLIKSFAEVIKEEVSAHLVLVGGEQKHINTYKELVKSLNTQTAVTFTGPLDSKLMPSIHSQADILASPRLCGRNTPLKIYSYMDAERLIIASNISSHTQVLSEKEAILCKPEIQDFVDGMKLALTSDNTNKIKAAKDLLNQKYSRARFQKQIKAMYQEVLCQ